MTLVYGPDERDLGRSLTASRSDGSWPLFWTDQSVLEADCTNKQGRLKRPSAEPLHFGRARQNLHALSSELFTEVVPPYCISSDMPSLI